MTRAPHRRTSERGRSALSLAARLMDLGLPRTLAAAAVGVDKATLSRWQRRARRDEPLVRRRGPRPQPANAMAAAQAADLVRTLAGQVGAESLRRSVSGLSRRQAGAVKRRVCRQLERERRVAATRVTVTAPGVLRGFDAMHVGPHASLLVAADGSVPYRTSWSTVGRYDGPAVAALLERDLLRHGDPLVLRMDRARQHHVAGVRELLAQHQVLLLQGPPHCSRYYGQLERQNREHRAWLRVYRHGAQAGVDTMMAALNGHWLRRTLGWRTAAEVWEARPQLQVDRHELRLEVNQEAERLRQLPALKGQSSGLAERLAIENALERRGLLRREKGGWC